MIDLIKRMEQHVRENPHNDVDGESPRHTKLQPGLNETEMADLERQIGFALPAATRELLLFSRGMEDGPTELLDFSGKPAKHLYILSPRRTYRLITDDGGGNCWFYDFDSRNNDLGPVYYYFHEGPIVLYQCATLTQFIGEWLAWNEEPYKSLIEDVAEFRCRTVNSLLTDLITHEDALTSGDSDMAEYAGQFSSDPLFYDFRNPVAGDGFDLSQLEAFDRHPLLPIYVLRKRPGLLKQLRSLFQPRRHKP